MKPGASIQSREHEWRFVSNHGVVLLALSRTPDVRIHQLATTVGITERACQKIVNDLRAAGYVAHRRVGRRNVYAVDASLPMRHPALRALQVRRLLQLWDGVAPPGGVQDQEPEVDPPA